MTPLFDFGALQDALADWPASTLPDSGVDGIFDRIRQILARSISAQRLLGIGDLIPLLRHVLRRQSLRSGAMTHLRVPTGGAWPTRDRWTQFGIRAHSEAAGQSLIEAVPWVPAWLPETDTPLFEDVFAEHNVRLDWRCPIDPFLAEASGFDAYVSPGQREAVRSGFLLPPGETLIVSLPTGSGKSFVAQAPVLVRGIEGGLTLCVVPTTALVLDQSRQVEQMLKRRFPRREVPALAWHAGLAAGERTAIKSAIREGRQGILYCSPEAMSGALLSSLYDAARTGLLSHLVVDEAHLISQWGDGFRPAFQMLAGVRRGLLRECPGDGFRTILMSATLTPDTIETLDALFGPASTVQMVASIHLRPEPQYWIHREDQVGAKDRKILEAIRHAPRPFILYVTKRDDAVRWLKMLRHEGFERTEAFHGDTGDTDRRRIIDEWSRNTLDGIVATSAFGVGIDKPDVRSIIHAAVPETVDRFYQEVGRGGRDGRPAASLLVYSQADREVADRLSAPTLISDELAFERWSAMFSVSKKLDPIGRLLELDLDVVPPRLRQQSDYNASWNMRTLIMMARAKMIELESRPPKVIARNEGETEASFDLRNEEHWASYFRKTVVSVLEFSHHDQSIFDQLIGDERSSSFHAASYSRALLDELLSGKAEISGLLDQLYRNYAPGRTLVVSPACGGCPVHRQLGTLDLEYAEPSAYGIEEALPFDASLWRERFPHINIASPVILPLAEPIDRATTMSILGDLVALFGIREIAVPDAFRASGPEFGRLHKQSADGILLIHSLEEETVRLPSYKLARATLLSGAKVPPHVMQLDRPLHIILTPASTSDPLHRERRLADTGSNILSVEQFKQGARL
jgi:ATP-dependent DNA helicase RecQ